jgi:hypothetical protein
MPFNSEKQRKWMHANQPEMAKKWEKEEKNEGLEDPDCPASEGQFMDEVEYHT